MDCSDDFWKFDKIDLIFINFILFIMVSIVTFADVESVDVSSVSQLSISPNTNYFISATSQSVSYVHMEKGYIYYFDFSGNTGDYFIAYSNSVPALNVPYSYGGLRSGNFSYMCTDDEYIYFSWAWPVPFTVTRERITDMGGVVSILSNDVGANQFWNIFIYAIPFILVVVLVVFGFFIIRRLTKKESKGDIRF